MKATVASERIPGLQILRGVAALLVVLDHSICSFLDKNLAYESWRSLAWQLGSWGVSLFFVLSGFMMVHTSYENFGVARAPLKFLMSRIRRVAPLYWLFTLFVFIRAGSHRPNVISLYKSFLFIPYSETVGAPFRPILGQGWTLDYGMFFYIVFAIGLLFPRRLGLSLIVSVLVAAFAAGIAISGVPRAEEISWVDFLLSPLMALFGVGMGLALLYRHDVLPRREVGLFQALSSTALIVALALVIYRFGLHSVSTPASRIAFMGGAAALVYISLWIRAADQTVPGRMLLLTGDASYSIYLSHVLTIGFVLKLLPGVTASPAVSAIVLVGISILAGWIIFRLVELPMDRTLRTLTG